MPNIFLISDTHFGHANICKFIENDGVTKIRPWDDVTEMDEAMISNWNNVVRPNDKTYHLGDVVFNRKYLQIMKRLNGDKILIKGNHDIFKLSDYTEHFRDIRAYHVLDGMVMSHIPLHRDSAGRFRANIHGHLHTNVVRNSDGGVDPFYFSVCVEKINYTPISLEEVKVAIRDRM